MKNFILLMLLFVGLMVSAAPPTDDPTVVPNHVVIQDGTQVSTAPAILDVQITSTAELDTGNDIVVSVDQLKEENRLFASLSPFPQDDPPELIIEEDPPTPVIQWLIDKYDFSLDNWIIILTAILSAVRVIVRVTPTEKDNDWFAKIERFLAWIIPNRKKGGGTHATPG